jgi:hypothetical protein
LIKNISNFVFLSDFLYHTRELFFLFILRGYFPQRLESVLFSIQKLSRNELLPYKHKNLSSNKFQSTDKDYGILFFVLKFESSFYSLNKSIYECWNTECEKNKLFPKYDLKVVNSVKNKLINILVQNRRLEKQYVGINSTCEKDCSNCKFMLTVDKITFKNGFILPINGHFDCKTTNCVYIILCLYCNSVYIDETKQTIKDRVYQHLQKILKIH